MNFCVLSGQILMGTYLIGFLVFLWYIISRMRWNYTVDVLQQQGNGVVCVKDRARINIRKDGNQQWAFKKFRRKYENVMIPDNDCVFPIQNFFRDKKVTFIEASKGTLTPVPIDRSTLKYAVDRYSAHAIKMVAVQVAEKIDDQYSLIKDKFLQMALPIGFATICVVMGIVFIMMSAQGDFSHLSNTISGVIPGG